MRILITNDDSISSPVLLPLVKWAQKLGEVTVLAPKFEQSGKSHGIEIHKSFEVKAYDLCPGVECYTVDSTPADCVRIAVLGMKKQFDLIISGINKGLNIGLDIAYSGTVGAIFEAACLGIPALALSTTPDGFDYAISKLDDVWAFFTDKELYKKGSLFNVNIPVGGTEIRITHQGGPYYSDNFGFANDQATPCGIDVFQASDDDTVDTDCVLRCGQISVTPLTLDRTDRALFAQLSK